MGYFDILESILFAVYLGLIPLSILLHVYMKRQIPWFRNSWIFLALFCVVATSRITYAFCVILLDYTDQSAKICFPLRFLWFVNLSNGVISVIALLVNLLLWVQLLERTFIPTTKRSSLVLITGPDEASGSYLRLLRIVKGFCLSIFLIGLALAIWGLSNPQKYHKECESQNYWKDEINVTQSVCMIIFLDLLFLASLPIVILFIRFVKRTVLEFKPFGVIQMARRVIICSYIVAGCFFLRGLIFAAIMSGLVIFHIDSSLAGDILNTVSCVLEVISLILMLLAFLLASPTKNTILSTMENLINTEQCQFTNKLRKGQFSF